MRRWLLLAAVLYAAFAAPSVLWLARRHRGSPHLGATKPRAIISMAAGDVHGRSVLALMQSLRDTGVHPDVHLVVMLFRGGLGSAACTRKDGGAWFRAHPERVGIDCSGNATVAEEVVSPSILEGLARLGVTTLLLDPIPVTPFTKDAPGGRSTFWGMAINKLRVLRLTQYSKLLFLDSDTLALARLDGLLDEPTFTTSLATYCCHPHGAAFTSGSLWVFEPSEDLWQRAEVLLREGDPLMKPDGTRALTPEGVPAVKGWPGDQDVLRAMITTYNRSWGHRPEWCVHVVAGNGGGEGVHKSDSSPPPLPSPLLGRRFWTTTMGMLRGCAHCPSTRPRRMTIFAGAHGTRTVPPVTRRRTTRFETGRGSTRLGGGPVAAALRGELYRLCTTSLHPPSATACPSGTRPFCTRACIFRASPLGWTSLVNFPPKRSW